MEEVVAENGFSVTSRLQLIAHSVCRTRYDDVLEEANFSIASLNGMVNAKDMCLVICFPIELVLRIIPLCICVCLLSSTIHHLV